MLAGHLIFFSLGTVPYLPPPPGLPIRAEPRPGQVYTPSVLSFNVIIHILPRVSEAVQLVDMYHCQHSSSAPMGMDGLKASLYSSHPQPLTVSLLLQSYLTVHGLSQYLDKLTGDRGE